MGLMDRLERETAEKRFAVISILVDVAEQLVGVELAGVEPTGRPISLKPS